MCILHSPLGRSYHNDNDINYNKFQLTLMHQVKGKLSRLSCKVFCKYCLVIYIHSVPSTSNKASINGAEVKAQLDHRSSRRHFISAHCEK